MTLTQTEPTSIKIGTTDVKKVTVWRVRLPSEYQEVEYIQSSGTQYFIVGSSFKTSYKSVIDFQMTVIGGDYVPLGCNNDSPFYRYGIDAWDNSFKIISGGRSRTSTISEDTNRHTITIDKSSAIVDGINYNVSYTNATIPRGIGVFGYNQQADGVGFESSAKLYKLDIYDENGTQIYDLVPCYRKLDNEIGMYDLVTSTFFTNQGTGTFTKGNDVGGLQEKQVRPTTSPGWQPGANTVAYYPLDGDVNDHSGNNRNLTVATGSMSYGNLTDGQYGIFNGSTILTTYNMVSLNSGTLTMWSLYSNNSDGVVFCNNFDSNNASYYSNFMAIDSGTTMYVPYSEGSFGTTARLVATGTYSANKWYFQTLTSDGSTLSYYLNGQYVTSKSTSFFMNMANINQWCVGGLKRGSQTYSKLNGGVSNLIIENKCWTAQEVSDYFDQTKGKYGL